MQLPAEQRSPLEQEIAVPWQVPLWQLSLWVQASPSLQLPPVLGGLVQVPVEGWQAPTLWHTSSALQITGFCRWQVPMQTSEPLQGLASSLQVLPPQQAWPMPPHWQVLPAPQVRLEPQAFPEAQQVWPSPPQAVQRPVPAQLYPALQVEPAQHSCADPPQASHVVEPLHALPEAHMLPGQQGIPAEPQLPHRPFWQTWLPSQAVPVAQQGSPAPPQ